MQIETQIRRIRWLNCDSLDITIVSLFIQGFYRLKEDLRRQQDDWKQQFQWLQKRYSELENKLFCAQQHNWHLKEDLQQKAELINKKDAMTDTLKHQLSGMKWRLDEVESSQAKNSSSQTSWCLRRTREERKRDDLSQEPPTSPAGPQGARRAAELWQEPTNRGQTV